MSVTAHRTERPAGRAPHVPTQPTTPADPRTVPPGTPVRRRVDGRQGPPTRRRVAGAPRVITRTPCHPKPRASALTLMAVGAAMCLAVVGLGSLAGAGQGAEVPTRTEVVRVQPGETLTDLATRMAPSADPAAVVARIHELNSNLTPLTPGRPLRVPADT